MRNYKISAAWVLLFLLYPGFNTFSQNNNLAKFQFIIGEWIGSGGGSISGKGQGGSVFRYDLDSNVIIRENYSQYPEQNGNPAHIHKDLMIIYYQSSKPKAVYFDNEKHVINYDIEFSENKIIFTSEVVKGIPQFRLTYEGMGDNKIKLNFDIAPPGASGKFGSYLTAEMHKK